MTDPTYTPHTWHDLPATDTPIDADQLNALENGVAAATARAVASVRFDAGQSLSGPQQTTVRGNIGAATITADPEDGSLNVSVP